MPAWSRVALALALVVSLPVVSTALATSGDAAVPDAVEPMSSEAAVQSPFNATTTYRIDVQATGDARWSVNRTFHFENESHREGFATVAERFEEGDYTGLTVSSFEGASDLVSDSTGRQMAITDVTRDARIGNESGSLVLSFTWTNFSYREDDLLHVDDVFRTDEPWFPGLSESETLLITPPEGYQFYRSSTIVQNSTLRWDGPYSFGYAIPYAVFKPPSSGPGTTTTEPPINGTTTAAPSTGGEDNAFVFVLGGIALLGALAAIAYISRHRDESVPAADVTGSDTPAAPNPGPADDGSSTDPSGADTDESGTADSDETDTEVDEELLSDEERVERLLADNDGRMKQANIVKETGWSNAKVSQLLSAMDEDGRIEKLRIGRENLISFPDDDSEDT